MSAPLAQKLFRPETIAIIGASADASKYASLPQQFLKRHGYGGRVVPINPRREEIMGLKAYPRVSAVEGGVDHAMILLPTDAVLGAVEDCCAAGVGCVTIISDGFAEIGPEGAERQARMVAMAREAGLRIVGPNSLGLVNTHGGVTVSANEVLSLDALVPGRTALVSQSGSLLGAVLSRGQALGLAFSKLVSVGNEADLGAEELIELFTGDADTDVVLLVLETIRQPERFEAATRAAYQAGKPVVAFRLGRSNVGEALAASHTGALVGNGAAQDAFLADCGVVCVNTFEALIEAAPLVAGRRPTGAASGRRVSVMTTTGGGGTLVIDALAARGVEIAAPSEPTREALAAQGIRVGHSPLVDLTLTGANPGTYGAVLGALLEDPGNDLVVPVVGSSAQFRPDRAIAPIVDAAAAGGPKPLAAFMTPRAAESVAMLHGKGIAAFLSPEICADAVAALFDWRAPRRRETEGADLAPVRAALDAAGGRTLNGAQARAVFAALGVAQPGESVLPPDPDAWGARPCADMAFPVAVKILSADIAHKTEIGGVRLGVASPEAVREAGEAILAAARAKAPKARLDGIQVETMEAGLAGALIGYRLDPVVGPTITVGLGGVLTEIYRDFALRLAPVDLDTAHAMIGEVRGLAAIRGYRNQPEGDVEALAHALVAVSRLALVGGRAVAEAEINPLLVREKGAGAVAVDGLIVLDEDGGAPVAT